MTINHLRRVRSHPFGGEYRYQMIVNDMLLNERKHGIVMIPEAARSTDIIREFTVEEAEADLQATGQINRRSSQMLRQEQRKLSQRKTQTTGAEQDRDTEEVEPVPKTTAPQETVRAIRIKPASIKLLQE